LGDYLNDADGLALHRVQVVFLTSVLFVVWRDMIQLGTVAEIDRAWAAPRRKTALPRAPTADDYAALLPWRIELPTA
jgi:hypothetical protein